VDHGCPDFLSTHSTDRLEFGDLPSQAVRVSDLNENDNKTVGMSRLCSATFEQLFAFGATFFGSSNFKQLFPF
jgi:hypothetical protein